MDDLKILRGGGVVCVVCLDVVVVGCNYNNTPPAGPTQPTPTSQGRTKEREGSRRARRARRGGNLKLASGQARHVDLPNLGVVQPVRTMQGG